MPYRFENKEVFGLGERDSGFKPRSINGFQDFKKIQEKCLTDVVTFEDEDFPAKDSSIGAVDGGPYIWKRPHEIVRGKSPRFIVDSAERFDVKQGDLGNCWLLAAIADLTLNKDIFRITIPEDNTFGKMYTGAFHFRFWQFGKWIEVVIDDRLPCTKDGKLAFMNSETKNEFWTPLLEKAYAKLNGSYQVLEGGLTMEGLQDFTGGFTEVFLVDRLKATNVINGAPEMFQLISRSFERGCFMGSSVKENPEIVEDELSNGLIAGHAYSITDMRCVNVDTNGEKGLVQLLRLRNPWGTDAEWKGDWSDSSPLWQNVPEKDREDIKLTFAGDGEFWISFEDFLDNFERIEACHTVPTSREELLAGDAANRWISHEISGSWTFGVTAGGSRRHKETFANNPQYVLKLGSKDGTEGDNANQTLIVCLLKKERKAELETADLESLNLSFNLFPLKANAPIPLSTEYLYDKGNPPIEQIKPLKGLREITVRFLIPAGNYVVVPSSIKPNQEGEFFLRVFTEGESTLDLYDKELNIKEQAPGTNKVTEKVKLVKSRALFKLVAGNRDEVTWWDLKMLLDKSFHDEFQYEGFGFSEDICRSMVALVDEDRSGRLNFFEFTNLWNQIVAWKKIFNEHDMNESNTLGSLKTNELRSAFNAGGYEVNKDILESIVWRYGDHNGEISLDKFIIAALKLKTMMALFKRREVEGQQSKAVFTLDQWLADTIYS